MMSSSPTNAPPQMNRDPWLSRMLEAALWRHRGDRAFEKLQKSVLDKFPNLQVHTSLGVKSTITTRLTKPFGNQHRIVHVAASMGDEQHSLETLGGGAAEQQQGEDNSQGAQGMLP
jgi:hypothetical protein